MESVTELLENIFAAQVLLVSKAIRSESKNQISGDLTGQAIKEINKQKARILDFRNKSQKSEDESRKADLPQIVGSSLHQTLSGYAADSETFRQAVNDYASM